MKTVPPNDAYSQPNQPNEEATLIILNSFTIGNENSHVKLHQIISNLATEIFLFFSRIKN
jgi:hypothetical protein